MIIVNCAVDTIPVVTEKTANNSISIFSAAMKNVASIGKAPKKFFTHPTFLFVCLVYSGTYITANSVLTYHEYAQKDPLVAKLGSTTLVNMTLGILKDRYFAQVFSGRPPEKFPLMSWGLFVVRDLMTIAAGFTVPAYVSQSLQDRAIITNEKVANAVAQVGVPVTAQLLLTPIHILSLDFYMNKVSEMKGRWQRVVHNAPDSTAIRMGRVLFAYGIGGVFNTNLRNVLRETFAYK